MPNHVANRITFDCSDEKAKELIKANNYAIGEPAQPETHEEKVPENVEPAEETEEEPTNEE